MIIKDEEGCIVFGVDAALYPRQFWTTPALRI